MHLGPVNTITFVDDNRRFVTTSDDKSIRAWDFDVPVNIKSIAEPDMHSIPAITLHPNGTFLLLFLLLSLPFLSPFPIPLFPSLSLQENALARFRPEGWWTDPPPCSLPLLSPLQARPSPVSRSTTRSSSGRQTVSARTVRFCFFFSFLSSSSLSHLLNFSIFDLGVAFFLVLSTKPGKKRFAGHTTAGYACSIGFSPDGRYISSGDASGNVVFWDYAKGKLIKRLKAHKEVVIDHLWLPHESSKLLTASWDGLVKLWD